MKLGRFFLLSIAAGFALVLGLTVIDGNRAPRPVLSSQGLPLRDDVFVRDQIALDDVAGIKESGYRTLIALRPDGEVAGQTPSADVAAAARARGLTFAYIPTPHGDIPASVPEALAKELASAPRPVLLYCRTGKRAARVWALAEAARADGASAEDIAAAVTGVSQPVDDILGQIKDRIAARQPATAQTSTAR